MWLSAQINAILPELAELGSSLCVRDVQTQKDPPEEGSGARCRQAGLGQLATHCTKHSDQTGTEEHK
jgi:hypothetical protein